MRSRTYLAHHELESDFITVTVIVIDVTYTICEFVTHAHHICRHAACKGRQPCIT